MKKVFVYNIDELYEAISDPENFGATVVFEREERRRYSWCDRLAQAGYVPIDKIIFNDPATIILWCNGEKTVVKVKDGEKFDPYVGFAFAVAKYMLGSNSMIKQVVEQRSNIHDIRSDE